MALMARSYDPIIQDIETRVSDLLSTQVVGTGTQANWELARDRALALARTSPDLYGEDEDTLEEVSKAVADDLYLLGPLEDLLADPDVSEIMVNAPDDVRIETGGKIITTDYHFRDDAHVMRTIQRIADADNRRCDNTNPMCDCTLHRKGAMFDGSRVNAVAMPIAVDHPLLDIRKFSKDKLSCEDLIKYGTMDERIEGFLRGLVEARMNIIIMGGTGSGKTTLLNAMSNFIPDDQRIITVEDTAELSLQKSHVLRMEARQANIEGAGAVSIRQIIINTLRQRPDRIVVGECRGPEAFDMLQAMGTGHDGSLTTIHANDTRGAIARLQMMIQMSEAGEAMPQSAIMQVITSAVDFVVEIRRFPDGTRKVNNIAEIQGMQDDGHGRSVATMASIMRFQMEGYTDDGRVMGSFGATGERMSEGHMMRFATNGVNIDDGWFQQWTL